MEFKGTKVPWKHDKESTSIISEAEKAINKALNG